MSLSQRLLLAFVAFVFVMFFTPGPNNIMLMSSGLTYGFRRTLPHMAGVTRSWTTLDHAAAVTAPVQ